MMPAKEHNFVPWQTMTFDGPELCKIVVGVLAVMMKIVYQVVKA